MRALRASGRAALTALALSSSPRCARAEAPPLADATPLAPASAELTQLRAELARQGRELEALNARQRGRARAPAPARVSGYAQVDFIPYAQASQNEIDFSTGSPLNQNRFTLRRGRLRVDADRGLLSAALEIDANTTSGPQLRPIAAELTLRWPEIPDPRVPSVAVSVGLMKIPFGFEVPELDVVRPFLERSTFARALFPGAFDLGARVRGQYRFVDLTVALMNGHPIGERAFPALAPNARKEIVARLAVSTSAASDGADVAFDLGVSIETGNGFHEGTPTTKDQLVWRDDNGDGIVQATEVQLIPGSSASASGQFPRFAWGADARLVLRFFRYFETTFRAEVVRASNLDRGLEFADPVGAGYDLRELGWYVGVTQELTRWGLFGVRYDRYNPDQDAREQQAAQVVPRDRSYSTLALLAMLRYERARLACEYDVNRNALGRDANGAPINLDSDVFTVRTQVQF